MRNNGGLQSHLVTWTATISLPFRSAQVVDVDDYRKAFDKFDTDGSGHWTEFAQVRHLGIWHHLAV